MNEFSIHSAAGAAWRVRTAVIAGLMCFLTTGPVHGQCEAVGSLQTSDSRAVVVAGTTAYVADGTGGLKIVDVSDQTSPTLLGSLPLTIARGIDVVGTTAYVADDVAGVQVIDVSNAASPAVLGNANVSASDVVVVGMTAYVAGGAAGFFTVDVSDAANPAVVGSVATPGLAVGLAVVGNVAYVADGQSGLQVISVLTASNPVVIGSVATVHFASDVAVSGGVAYVADEGGVLQIIDVTNPAAPAIVGMFNDFVAGGPANSVDVSGTTVYVGHNTCCGPVTALHVLDASNLQSPVLLGYVPLPDPRGVTYVDGTVYVASSAVPLEFASLYVVPIDPCLGACCYPGGTCAPTFETDCLQLGGTWQGPQSECTSGCPAGLGGSDACADATRVTTGTTSFTLAGATTDAWPSIPDSCGAGRPGLSFLGDIWFEFRPPWEGLVTVSVCGTSYDTGLVAYSSCSNSSFRGCDDDSCGAIDGPSEMSVFTELFLPPIKIGVGAVDGGGIGTMSITIDPGTCCFIDGSCLVLASEECAGMGGSFAGGIYCSNCPPIGACCLAMTCAADTLQGDCAAAGGVFLGAATSCDPGACLPATGACCGDGGLCIVAPEPDCTNFGGTYQGDNTTCAPTSCLACAADLGGNGEVDFADVLSVIAAWGPCGALCPEDLDGNGDVGFADILAVISAWGPCP